MAILAVHSNKTKLKGRTLYYDGDIEVQAKMAPLFALSNPGIKFYVDEITNDQMVGELLIDKDNRVQVKSFVRPLDFAWKIPEKYLKMSIDDRICDALVDENLSDDELAPRIVRMQEEMQIYKKLDLLDFLRTLCYIVDTLEEKNIPWGVGRGSSVSSYVLYLIGIHDIDSVKFELKFKEFIKIS